MFTQVFFDLYTHFFQFGIHHLLDQSATTAARTGGFGAAFNAVKIHATRSNRRTNIAFADVITRANLRTHRQCICAECRGGRTIKAWQNQRLRIVWQIHVIQHQLQQTTIRVGITDQHRAKQFFAIGRDHQFFIHFIRFIDIGKAACAFSGGMCIANRGHIHPKQFQLG